jgi:predicted enzyme related to lactoylglutathione lyase
LITIDCSDPEGLAQFWADALDFKITFRADDGGEVAVERDDESGPALLFIRVPDAKAVKNRIHFDLNPDDQAAEVERLKGLGATSVDIGQRNVNWVVMADPEGNEFCVLTPR